MEWPAGLVHAECALQRLPEHRLQHEERGGREGAESDAPADFDDGHRSRCPNRGLRVAEQACKEIQRLVKLAVPGGEDGELQHGRFQRMATQQVPQELVWDAEALLSAELQDFDLYGRREAVEPSEELIPVLRADARAHLSQHRDLRHATAVHQPVHNMVVDVGVEWQLLDLVAMQLTALDAVPHGVEVQRVHSRAANKKHEAEHHGQKGQRAHPSARQGQRDGDDHRVNRLPQLLHRSFHPRLGFSGLLARDSDPKHCPHRVVQGPPQAQVRQPSDESRGDARPQKDGDAGAQQGSRCRENGPLHAQLFEAQLGAD
mmetsp:Transcript_25379/g.73231  ORF Transcript_25379/g.73231 Transcript_25379/m.73231 type:complete len:317 (-) Transcript_25379:1281-2231(-)